VNRKIHLIDHDKLVAEGHNSVALKIGSTGSPYALTWADGRYQWALCSIAGDAARVPILKLVCNDPVYERLFIAEQLLQAGHAIPKDSKILELNIVASGKDPIGEYLGLLLILES